MRINSGTFYAQNLQKAKIVSEVNTVRGANSKNSGILKSNENEDVLSSNDENTEVLTDQEKTDVPKKDNTNPFGKKYPT